MKYLYQPLNSIHINQSFGENKACVNSSNEIINCDGNNPPSGYWSLYGPSGHLGVDLAAGHGMEVYAAQRGTVYHIDTNEKSGLDVRIESEENGIKFRHIYEHLLGYQPRVGDYVKTGQVIGWADNTGYSSGDHLHFQVEQLTDGVWTPIDPMSVMEMIPAKKILLLNNTLTYIAEQIASISDNLADIIRKKVTK